MDHTSTPPCKEKPLREEKVNSSVNCLSGCFMKVFCGAEYTHVERQVVYAGLVASVGVALGVVLAYPALTLEVWAKEREVRLSLQEAAWFRSVAYLGSIPGSVVGGMLMQLLGPRRLLLLLLPALTLAWMVLPLLTPHAPLLIALRALQGVLVAAGCLCVYVYPCELVEARLRDLVGALPETAFSLGFLLSYLLEAALHWSVVVLLVPCCILLPTALAVAFVPESLTCLVRHGHLQEAREVLAALRPPATSVEKELLALQLGSSRSSEEEEEDECSMMLLRRGRFLLPVLAALTLVLLKEGKGQMVVVLALGRMLEGDATGLSLRWGCVVVGAARASANVWGCCLLLRRWPRRTLLCCFSLVATAAMVLLANYYAFVGSVSWPPATPLVLTVMFVVSYGAGVGPVAGLMVCELLPGPVRDIGSGFANALLGATQFSLTFLAPTSPEQLTLSCWAYSGGCLLLAGFSLLLPETRHRPLHELEAFWRDAAEANLCSRCLTPTKQRNPSPIATIHPSLLPTTYDSTPFSSFPILPPYTHTHTHTPHLPTSASLPIILAPLHTPLTKCYKPPPPSPPLTKNTATKTHTEASLAQLK